MNQDEIRQIRNALQRMTSPLQLSLHEKRDEDFSNRLRDFVEELSNLSRGKIAVHAVDRKGEGESPLPGIPAVTLSAGEKAKVAYLAIPEGPELPPFLKLLESLSGDRPPLPSEIPEALARITEPAEIWVLISALCPHCPKVVEVVLALASSSPTVSVSIVDVEPFSKIAKEYSVKSVPATIIDRELVLIGQQSAERLSELLILRGTEDFDGEIIRSLMERGRASDAAKYICEGRGRTAILSLFQEPELSTRMGVLMVLEESLDMDSSAVQEMVPSLIVLLSHDDSRIRGDIADLLGKVGDPRAIPYLEKLADDPDPDVVEAASDALEELT